MPGFRAHRALFLIFALLSATARRAAAWDTHEHVRFGLQIATPFEQKLGPLPVRQVVDPPGPQKFGEWVSAPDFARGLLQFLQRRAGVGNTPCSAFWTPQGLELGGIVGDDQTLGMNAALAREARMADCLDVYRVNNSHFGDFARNHFQYYHGLALEAARRWRATRHASCHDAIYTLEAWALHYLTDSTALGHAWNPPGDYQNPWGKQTLESPVRRSVHNTLNQGGLMAGRLGQRGIFFGDHSSSVTPDRKGVPDADGNPQRELTLRLSRMALGDVVAAAECGANPNAAATLTSPDENADPRQRIFASNSDLCHALWGLTVLPFAGAWNTRGLTYPRLVNLVQACEAHSGFFLDPGAELASGYFTDAKPISAELDPQAKLELENLDCPIDAEPEPLDDQVIDACGNALCDVPPGTGGTCPQGLALAAGCC
jgi:hypothetical protein